MQGASALAQRDCGAGLSAKHGAQEEEAAKASLLGFNASASGAGFEPACFLVFWLTSEV
jgi:hypothetical protein